MDKNTEYYGHPPTAPFNDWAKTFIEAKQKEMDKELIEKGKEYYDSIDCAGERRILREEYGKEGELDREFNFYKWLAENKINQ